MRLLTVTQRSGIEHEEKQLDRFIIGSEGWKKVARAYALKLYDEQLKYIESIKNNQE